MVTSKRILFAVLAVFFLHSVAATLTSGLFSATYQNAKVTIQPGLIPTANAWAEFNATNMETGWHLLKIRGNANIQQSDEDMSYSAGYIEGFITQRPIYDTLLNFKADMMSGLHAKVTDAINNWATVNWQWTLSTAAKGAADSSDAQAQAFWRHVLLVGQQLEGIFDGYQAAAPSSQKMTFLDLLLMQLDGDLEEITTAMQLATGEMQEGEWLHKSAKQAQMEHLTNTHCSVLIRLTNGDGSNGVLAGHTTWDDFAMMLRVYKVYTLPFTSVPISSESVGFSSSPSWISSIDDYFTLSNGMMVTETTNGLMDDSLYKLITPQAGVTSWVRAQISNRMANNAQEWTEIFSISNSGTYNNQWIVLNPLERGQAIPDGSLWIAEQVPGFIQTGDVTEVLRKTGYWPSFNIPYFENVYNVSGFETYAEKYGDDWTWSKNFRAKIFADQQGKVNDMAAMRAIMQYNDYPNDPNEEGDACNGIAARCDLNPKTSDEYFVFGGLDAKITDVTLLKSQPLYTEAISGPTYQNGMPVFVWKSEYSDIPHYGMPDVWHFDWIIAPTALEV